ncbi:MAG: VCBS domain-containing protein [Variovorax sp.]
MISISALDGLTSVTVGGTTVDVATLNNLGTTPVTIQTPSGTLVLTGFVATSTVGGVPTAGQLSYSYQLDTPIAQPGATESLDPIALSVLDAGGGTSTGVLSVRIVDDAPVAGVDAAGVTEDGPSTASGNVKGNDTVGADASNGVPVTAVNYGGVAGSIGSPLTTAFGSVTINADGSYTYTLDNDNPAVQHLTAGETLTETVQYTLTDADGDTTTATLTILISGRNDTAKIVIPDANGTGVAGQATVAERGLGDSADSSETVSGSFSVSTPDGLGSIEVGGTAVTPAQLANLGTTPVTVDTGTGRLTLTGYDPVTGIVQYSYTLDGRQQHGGGQVTDPITIIVRDRDGDSATGTLTILVVDDAPIARTDFATIGLALPGASVTGNVVGGNARGPGDVADRIGADFTPVPVTAFSFEGRPGVVGGGPLAGAYGTLRMAADGSYTYVVDSANPRLAALGDGQTLTEVFSYTITDADGSTSTAQLIITIQGATPPQPALGEDIWPMDFATPYRYITQGMEPALFVQLAVRESQQLSQRLAGAIASRVAGGIDRPYDDPWNEDIFAIPQGMDPAEHVSRDGVAFSRGLVRDIDLTLETRGLLATQPVGNNALYNEFAGFGSERIVVPGAVPVERTEARPATQPAARARSFTERLHATAGEHGTVRDRVKAQQAREALRVKVPPPPQP